MILRQTFTIIMRRETLDGETCNFPNRIYEAKLNRAELEICITQQCELYRRCSDKFAESRTWISVLHLAYFLRPNLDRFPCISFAYFCFVILRNKYDCHIKRS